MGPQKAHRLMLSIRLYRGEASATVVQVLPVGCTVTLLSGVLWHLLLGCHGSALAIDPTVSAGSNCDNVARKLVHVCGLSLNLEIGNPFC
jgi:hypothetical protein